MGDITVKIDGVSAVIARLEEIKRNIDSATRDGTQRAGETLQRDARANFQGVHGPGYHHGGGDRPNTVSGHLQGSIIFLNPVLSDGPGSYQTRIGPTAVYGRLIELGGTISPKAAGYLSWFDSQMGVRRFTKEVTVPPYPYFRPAWDTLAPKMERIFATAWTGAWNG